MRKATKNATKPIVPWQSHLPYRIDFRYILESRMPVVEAYTFEVKAPHGPGIDIQENDIILSVAISYQLIVHSVGIIHDIIRYIVTENPAAKNLLTLIIVRFILFII